MKAITGYIEDEFVFVDGIKSVTQNGEIAEIAFSNQAEKGGHVIASHVIATLPSEALKIFLGLELREWLLLKMDKGTFKGDRKPLSSLLRVYLVPGVYEDGSGGNQFRMMFGHDFGTVVFAMPEDAAIKSLGEGLYRRLMERGEMFWLAWMREVNREAMEEEKKSRKSAVA